MNHIKYEILLNEHGRPYINLPDDYDHMPEDRFFTIEITRYIIQDLLNRRTLDLDENTVNRLYDAESLLGQVGDNIADILYGDMRVQGEIQMSLNPLYHIMVDSIEDRDNLPEKDIIFQNRIFDRVIGLRVLVRAYNPEEFTPLCDDIYELVNGINNENWVKK